MNKRLLPALLLVTTPLIVSCSGGAPQGDAGQGAPPAPVAGKSTGGRQGPRAPRGPDARILSSVLSGITWEVPVSGFTADDGLEWSLQIQKGNAPPSSAGASQVVAPVNARTSALLVGIVPMGAKLTESAQLKVFAFAGNASTVSLITNPFRGETSTVIADRPLKLGDSWLLMAAGSGPHVTLSHPGEDEQQLVCTVKVAKGAGKGKRTSGPPAP